MRDSGHMRSVAGQGDDCTDSLLLLDGAGVSVDRNFCSLMNLTGHFAT